MLAHQGGWDELLLPVLIVALVLVVPALRRRRRARADGSTADAPPRERDPSGCVHCGAAVAPGDARCPACGFRVKR